MGEQWGIGGGKWKFFNGNIIYIYNIYKYEYLCLVFGLLRKRRNDVGIHLLFSSNFLRK